MEMEKFFFRETELNNHQKEKPAIRLMHSLQVKFNCKAIKQTEFGLNVKRN